MADAHGSGPCVRKDVGVQLPPRPLLTSASRGFLAGRSLPVPTSPLDPLRAVQVRCGRAERGNFRVSRSITADGLGWVAISALTSSAAAVVPDPPWCTISEQVGRNVDSGRNPTDRTLAGSTPSADRSALPAARTTSVSISPSAAIAADRLPVPLMIANHGAQGDAHPRPPWTAQSPLGQHRAAVVRHEPHRPPRDCVALVRFVGGQATHARRARVDAGDQVRVTRPDVQLGTQVPGDLVSGGAVLGSEPLVAHRPGDPVADLQARDGQRDRGEPAGRVVRGVDHRSAPNARPAAMVPSVMVRVNNQNGLPSFLASRYSSGRSSSPPPSASPKTAVSSSD